MAFDQIKYNNDYTRTHYKRLSVLIPQDKAAALQSLAQQKGKSMNQLIVDALEGFYQIDLKREIK